MFYPDDDRMIDRISVRFTEDEYEAVKREAKALGLSAAAYVRKVCLERGQDNSKSHAIGGVFVPGKESGRDICLALATLITKMDMEISPEDDAYNDMARKIFARMQHGK